jgi:hypothetical protein
MKSGRPGTDVTDRDRRAIPILAIVCVGVGLFAAAYGSYSSDGSVALIGVLVLAGAMGAALVFRAMIRLTQRVAELAERVEQLTNSLGPMKQTDTLPSGSDSQPCPDSNVQVIDLAAEGHGDPATLTGATLPGSAFPRLVATSEEPAAEESTEEESPIESENDWLDNLRSRWRQAESSADLAECRTIHAAIVARADAQTAGQFTVKLGEITERIEKSLRHAFAERIRLRDFDGALAVGRQISELFAGQPLALEFERIRPHLMRARNAGIPDTAARVPAPASIPATIEPAGRSC